MPGMCQAPPLYYRHMSFHLDLTNALEQNTDFRRVLFTGTESQLVLMTIPPGGEVGEEVHEHTEQTLLFQSGSGEGLLGSETFSIQPGDVVVVTPGTRHNFKNTSSEPMHIVTVYAPPHHIDGRVHETKHDAEQDVADEVFGEEAEQANA